MMGQHLAVVRLLVESGASGATALDVASARGHGQLVGFLASLAKEPPKTIRRDTQ